jgi:hypothetical protein
VLLPTLGTLTCPVFSTNRNVEIQRSFLPGPSIELHMTVLHRPARLNIDQSEVFFLREGYIAAQANYSPRRPLSLCGNRKPYRFARRK